MNDLRSIPVQFVKSIGAKRAESFGKIGIITVDDLLFYFPRKHLDRSNVLSAQEVYNYVRNGFEGEITIIGEVTNKEIIRTAKRKILKVGMRDDSGIFECVWFQGIRYFQNYFNTGEYFAISAKPVISRYGNLQFAHPDYDKIEKDETIEFRNTGKIIPFYALPKELKSSNIGDFSMRRILFNAVNHYADEVPESLPTGVIEKNNLLPISETVRSMHFPQSNEILEKAKHRLKFEELFYLELLVAKKRHFIKNKLKGNKFTVDKNLVNKFLKSLPFELTNGQISALHEIRLDMESDKPMNRLLQGDVGSGKTLVAVIALLIAIGNGYQGALMVPTEILAHQHFLNITKLLEKFDIKITIVIGGQKKREREKAIGEIKSGKADLIVGTHALFEEKVEFKKLGLVIIDEQHRFGVAQRFRLISKGIIPDVLIMTATPIPRTLTMSIYGDLDVSFIKELPKNRIPIITTLRSDNALPDIYKFIVEKSKVGYQSFIVFPLVEESEKLQLKAAEEYYQKLTTTYLKEIKVGLLHGKMNWKDKEEIMLSFARGNFDALIATTVIEVGIDIPRANIIVINDAYRFGLSQLHQLRGRVGRGNKQAYCILIGKENHLSRNVSFNFEYLSKNQIEMHKAAIRLKAMEKYDSGFDLAEIDLKLRGPGDLFGTKQSGLPEFKYAALPDDASTLQIAKQEAFGIIQSDPDIRNPENKIIRDVLNSRYSENIKFAEIA